MGTVGQSTCHDGMTEFISSSSPSSALDHSPLLLRLVQKRRRRPKKLFRFESMWLKDPRCEEVVLEAWNDGLAD